MSTPRTPVALMAAAQAIVAGSVAFGAGLALPARAGVVANSGPYDTLSAFPTAGAVLDTRLGAAGGAIPVAWNTSLAMGNGGWELGLGSVVSSSPPSSIVRFDTLSPWGRFKLPAIMGIPLALIAGATIPAATGSATITGLGLGASFDWDGDRVDVNVGARLDPANAGSFLQGAAHVLFTHPLAKDFAGNAEIVFHGGIPATSNLMVERLGFTRKWGDNWSSDLSITLGTPLSGTGPLTVAPSLGLTCTF